MQYREDRQSGNRLSALGFGCMRFPMKAGHIDQDAVTALVAQAIQSGVNYFDTAYAYPGSEDALGRALAQLDARDQVHIASKMMHRKIKQTSDFDRMLETTLSRLQTNHVDYYLVHNVIRCADWERLVGLGITDWIAQKKAEGSIGQMGFSFHGNLEEFKLMMDSYPWDFVQIQYNYVNEHYQAGREGLELAEQRGLPVIIMEPLLGGTLADKLPPEPLRVFQQSGLDATPASWGLRWLWDQPGVTVVLSGMNKPEQLTENCAIASDCLPGSLTDQQRAVLAEAKAAFEKNFRVPCAGCSYCMPCPKGINIPAMFAAYNESYAFGWTTGMFHYYLSAGVTSKQPHFASDCVSCGACVKKCPQGIDVPASLVAVKKRLQPPGSKVVAKIVSKVAN